MGEYYKWVNVDKKEYLSPTDFGLGNKRYESLTRGNAFLCSLRELLDEHWKGDHIAFLGDEFSVSGNESNALLRSLYQQTLLYGKPGSISDLIDEKYRNVSCLFRDAEKEVRKEISFYIESMRSGEAPLTVNEYGVNLERPFENLFSKKGRTFQYTINCTKGVCYSFNDTQILHLNHTHNDYADPLPLLMSYGRTSSGGQWLGDIVAVADDIPDNVLLLDRIYLDW
ncbi:MAG: hypothetical protein LUC39_02435 [Clostridiales bacterium]|nr:hypothetical protein [Clostridiales bacterium]